MLEYDGSKETLEKSLSACMVPSWCVFCKRLNLTSYVSAVDDVVNESSDSEMKDRSTAQMKIDEWLNFKLDREVRT